MTPGQLVALLELLADLRGQVGELLAERARLIAELDALRLLTAPDAGDVPEVP